MTEPGHEPEPDPKPESEPESAPGPGSSENLMLRDMTSTLARGRVV